MIDRAKFFAAVRDNPFDGRLTQDQVDGMNTIIDAWEQSGFNDLRWLAYMLGTAYHETGQTMQPVHENGGDAYFTRMYDITGNRPDMARRMGNTEQGDGVKYCGRGFVQLTWKCNYQKMDALLNANLVNDPDQAMQPAIAAKIMIIGMTDRDPANTFSGVNLQRYFNEDTEDWVGARHIINVQDHAQDIADTSQDFGAALGVVPTV